MVWAGVSGFGRTPLIFVPPGVKINSATYRDLILDPVVKDLGATMFNKNRFLFQQDGAPAHQLESHRPGFLKIFRILSTRENGHHQVQI